MHNKKTIAVDFDGVIHKYSRGFQDGLIYDEPIVGAKESLEKLCKKFEIIIFTTRLNTQIRKSGDLNQKAEIIKWLSKYGFKKGLHYHRLTSIKPIAFIYLDDRGLRFENWPQALDQIQSLTT